MELTGNRVIAVVRTHSAADALTIGRALADTEVSGIEITMTVPDAVEVITALVSEGARRVGAGTVRTLDQLNACAAAGASFLVSPHLDPELVTRAVQLGVPAIPGTLTPSEIIRAFDLGATAFKLFPVSSMGGQSYVRALAEPFPDLRFVISGEATLGEVEGYQAAGAWAVCIGSSLWPALEARRGDVDAVRTYARSQLALLTPIGV